jgi:23S rRNA (uracil1939-C5)-methyltransferase
MERNKPADYQDVQVTAVGIDDEGKGIIRYEGETLFVRGLLPEEKGLVRLFKYQGKTVEAALLKRLSSSSLRVTPPCPYYEECGGCSLMHISYADQLIYKQEKVKNLLHKFAHLDVEVQPTLGMDNPYHFRNKVQVPIRLVHNKVCSGFFKENTHDLVPIDNCLIETEKATEILKGIKHLMDKYHIPPYEEDKGTGLIRHILIKESLHFDEAMVVLVTADRDFYGKANLAKEIIKLFPSVKTVVQNINYRHTNVILGDQEEILYGTGKIKDSIFGLTFLISSLSFYQTNPIMTEKLYQQALNGAELTGQEEVLDAYSGTGTIGISASLQAKHVTCVEIVSQAVKDGKLNAKINKRDNVAFLKADCTAYLLDNKDRVHYDVVFMDPPRKGSTPEFLNALKDIKPKKIVYISCNPVTLARDLAYLKDAYDIEKVTPVDMFPQTAHVETVVALSLRKNLKEPINAN